MFCAYYKWMDAIYPYVKSEQAIQVSQSGSARYRYHKTVTTGTTTDYGSYSINSAYYGGGDAFVSPAGEIGVTLADVGASASTVWVIDGELPNAFEFAGSLPGANPKVIPHRPHAVFGLSGRHLLSQRTSAPFRYSRYDLRGWSR